MDDLRALRTFLVVAEERYFGRSAERLNLAQPAVSEQIKRLEKDLGASVSTRTTRTVELTDVGLHLLARDARIRWMSSEPRQKSSRSGAAGRAGSPSASSERDLGVVPRCSAAARRAPDIELELHGEQLSPTLLEMLAERRVDLRWSETPNRATTSTPAPGAPSRAHRGTPCRPRQGQHPVACGTCAEEPSSPIPWATDQPCSAPSDAAAKPGSPPER